MTPEQRARLEDAARYPMLAKMEDIKAALAHIDALEARVAGIYTDFESRTWWSDAHMKRAALEAKTYQDLLQVETARANALAAERDAALASEQSTRGASMRWQARAEQAERERDALAAEVERLQRAELAESEYRMAFDGFTPYLKEGESPLERLERERKDCFALMGLLAKEKERANAAEQRVAELERHDCDRWRWEGLGCGICHSTADDATLRIKRWAELEAAEARLREVEARLEQAEREKDEAEDSAQGLADKLRQSELDREGERAFRQQAERTAAALQMLAWDLVQAMDTEMYESSEGAALVARVKALAPTKEEA